jgi:glutaminyl-peptide cyclotransferase
MTDILATIPGVGPSIVVIGGHYDTKRIATPLAGANDGGSSAAFLLELARVLTQRHNKATYWLVLFDGEGALGRWSETDGLYGSRHFTRRLADEGAEHQIKEVIVNRHDW